jgi:hypothetical protein
MILSNFNLILKSEIYNLKIKVKFESGTWKRWAASKRSSIRAHVLAI